MSGERTHPEGQNPRRFAPYQGLSEQEFDALRGQVLAVQRTTLQLLGSAENLDQLHELMSHTPFAEGEWLPMSGPPLGPPLTIDELNSSGR